MTREEIAEALASRFEGRLADAVRALPVLPTCSDCAWSLLDVERGRLTGFCSHDGGRMRRIETAAPPDWCPLREGAR